MAAGQFYAFMEARTNQITVTTLGVDIVHKVSGAKAWVSSELWNGKLIVTTNGREKSMTKKTVAKNYRLAAAPIQVVAKTDRPELFKKTTDLLIEAWSEGGLMHGFCAACAVGNICGGNNLWSVAFMTGDNGEQEQYFKERHFLRSINGEMAINLIESTGYTIEELARVEHAFESSISHNYQKLRKTSEGQYIGLCAVLDVLIDIHQVNGTEARKGLDSVATDKGVIAHAVQSTQA